MSTPTVKLNKLVRYPTDCHIVTFALFNGRMELECQSLLAETLKKYKTKNTRKYKIH